MRTVQRIEKKGNASRLVAVEAGWETGEITARVSLISLGLGTVVEELQ